MLTRTKSAVLCASMLVSGCSGLLNNYVKEYGGLIAAEPLSPIVDIPAPQGQPVQHIGPTDVDVEKDKSRAITYVVLEAFSSMSKCKELLDRQGIVSRGIDADLDLVTTVLTALATAFTPVQTIHALTAAALITSGWKTALDSDLYAKKTADIIATQIDASYFGAMVTYVNDFATRASLKNAAIYPQLEFLKIALIHRQCSIDLALGALAQKAKTPSESDSSVITLSDLQDGKALPGHLPGGPWRVLAVTLPYVLIQQTSSQKKEVYTLDRLLGMLNVSP